MIGTLFCLLPWVLLDPAAAVMAGARSAVAGLSVAPDVGPVALAAPNIGSGGTAVVHVNLVV